ncbi:Fc receptor-like protein 5 [Triplophysa rosa]|uniref:Fc receptor-like protein 5 n=1 Tax=Triplophysa rosa TaxID=992332 RepID=UPI002545D14E|nr:Fc receptor-like protein 5 [Triplophysa rosa]
MELSSLLLVLLLISAIHSEETEESQTETENASESQSSHMDDADKKASDIKPTLTVEPQSSVFTGDSVTLTCEVDQSTGWEFLFYTPSNHEPIEASGTKTISSVRVSDGGEYKCRVKRGEIPENYTQYSEPVTVKVEKRPKAQVSVRPDEHVFRGETVTLTCVINGGGVTSWQYRWNKDSVIEQNKQQNYTISPVSQSDAGKYTCEGTETGGSRSSDTSESVTLTVSERPKAQVSVRPDEHVFRGETVTLTCVINGGGVTSWQYRWNKDSVIQQNKQQKYTISLLLSLTQVNTPVEEQRSEDHQTPVMSYTDILSKYDIIFTALPRATVRVTPDTSVFTGETVTLKCEIEKHYTSLHWRYLWYNSRRVVSKTPRYTVNTNTLTISSVTQSDQNQFWCKTEIHGRPQTSSSSPVYLTVKALPRATVRVTPDTSVFTGETVTLKCEIEKLYTSLHWRYLWYKDRREVLNSERYTVNTNTLTISSVTQSDQNQFWCRGERAGRPSSSQDSDHVTLSVKGSKPKAELRSDTEGSVLTGNTVTLKCLMNQFTGWKFYWYQHTLNTEKKTTNTNSFKLYITSVSDGGLYWCRAGRGNPVYYTDYSDVLWINVTESPKAVLTVEPDKQLFSGETVTLRCDIQTKQDTEWTYRWTVEKYNPRYTVNQCKTQECKIRVDHSDSGKYTCGGTSENGQKCEKSEAVTLTVSSYQPKTVLRVSPQQWLTEGDSVTLMCEVNRYSTGWTFSWFTEHNLSSGFDLVSDSSGGSKGDYTVSSAALKHTGVYMCRAERGDPVYHTHNSSTQPLWITGVSSSVSLIIRPNRTQHFSSESLSLSCEDHRNSTGWTVRRYTNTLETCPSSSVRSTGTESTCTITSLITSDTGVYWCESESGHKLHPVNISIHNGDVILDSPVHPVTEGDSLTLHCLYRDKNPSNLRAEFYKDGSEVQNQTTGDMMIISTVSKSHEGFYSCQHPERGASPKRWISVTASGSPSQGLIVGAAVGLSVMFLIIVLVLLRSYRNKKGKVSESPSGVSPQQNISQTSDQKQNEDTPLQSGQSSSTYEDAHIYDSVDAADNKNSSTAVTVSGPSDVLYSQVDFKKKKRKSKDNVRTEADVTYADIELKPKKEVKKKKEKKENNKESHDTLYSDLKTKGHRDVGCGSNDVTYAQIK